jgi:hypothetical protein
MLFVDQKGAIYSLVIPKKEAGDAAPPEPKLSN